MKVAFVAAIALMSGINVFNAQKSEVLSDIVLANVEALADKSEADNGGDGNTTIYCCGNWGACMVLMIRSSSHIKSFIPCPN